MERETVSQFEWEAWPSGRDATTWHDGQLRDLTLEQWSQTVTQFLGCGFRVRVPASTSGSDPLNYARGAALRVADAFAQPLDQIAWDAIATLKGSFVVEGGWEYWPGEAMGAPWTRVAAGGRTHSEARIVQAVRLPWAWSSDGATAKLPMISTIEAGQAERHLRTVGAGMGLWFNHRDELCMSTSGPVLVQTGKRSWTFPGRQAGLVSNWAFFEIANRLGALPATITSTELAESRAVCAVSDLANIYLIESIDDLVSSLDPEQVATLMQVRRGLLLS